MISVTHRIRREALPVLVQDLEQFGARVEFRTENWGIVHSIAGQLEFEHSEETLTVRVMDDKGHFSPLLLLGGIRQMVEEAAEKWRVLHA